jgi:hypothetical protein
MPKKTRKEKLLAQKRRMSSPTPISPIVSPFQYQSTQSAKKQQTALVDTQELKTIKTDLAKTIILAIVAISMEVGMYYWLLKK